MKEAVSTVSAEKPARGIRLRIFFDYLRSLFLSVPLVCTYTAACGALSLAGSIFDSRGRWQHGCARTWSRLILRTSGVRVRVEGLENVRPGEPAIYCSNHASAMDIPILLARLPVQFRFLAKQSLFNVPFLGWHLRRSGHIPVDREHPREALKSFDRAAARIREGSPVVMFPEGHRTRDGQLRPFKAGGFYLAIVSGAPVVPITLNRTRRALRPDTVLVRPGETEMIVHKPIPTAGLSTEDADRLSERVRGEILSRYKPDP